jgi:hypothetical protein
MTMEELLKLPVSITIRDLARALGIGKSAAYDQARNEHVVEGIPVHRRGAGYRVNRADLFRALGLDPRMTRTPEPAPGEVA